MDGDRHAARGRKIAALIDDNQLDCMVTVRQRSRVQVAQQTSCDGALGAGKVDIATAGICAGRKLQLIVAKGFMHRSAGYPTAPLTT